MQLGPGMKDIYHELMHRSIENTYNVIHDVEIEEIQNIEQFALELYRFRVMAHAQNQQAFPQHTPTDWDRQ